MDSITTRAAARDPFTRPIAFLSGMVAGLLLLVFYLALVSVANSPGHAWDLLWADRYLVGAVAAGFGLQVGMYVYVRLLRSRARSLRSRNAAAAAGTGASTVGMVACCAHHITDVVPLVGFSGLTVLLNEYRLLIIVVGLAANATGIVVMLRAIRARNVQLRSQMPALVGGKL